MEVVEWVVFLIPHVVDLAKALFADDDEAELQASLVMQRKIATKKAELKFKNLVNK